jgi:hypothetical protein
MYLKIIHLHLEQKPNCMELPFTPFILLRAVTLKDTGDRSAYVTGFHFYICSDIQKLCLVLIRCFLENKKPLFTQTALTDWFFLRKVQCIFYATRNTFSRVV